jgi:hypothetical protein
VGPKAGLNDAEKTKFLTLLGLELRPLTRPTRSQLLYRLRYPGSVSVSYRLPHVLENQLTDGCEVVSLTRRPATLYPQEDWWDSFVCLIN